VGNAIARNQVAIRAAITANGAYRFSTNTAIYDAGFNFRHDTRASAAEYPFVFVYHCVFSLFGGLTHFLMPGQFISERV
jgi:hypothetical protein